MVNFRFHLVSLTAVFLALAAGIAIGAGVVDRQTVGFLEDRLATVERNRDETNQRNDELQGELDVWNRFAEEAGDRMVEGRLQDAPIVLASVDGTDPELVDRVRATIEAAGGSVQATLWFTDRWALEGSEEVEALAGAVGASVASRPAELRGFALGSLVAAWSGEAGDAASGGAAALRDAGFLEFDPTPDQPIAIEQVSLANVDVVVVSSGQASVANDELVAPFARALVDLDVGVAVAEPASPRPPRGADESPAGGALAVRADDGLATRVTTVDNVDHFRGRVALVLALDEVADGRTGHYGTGEGAQRLLPEAPA